MRQAAEREGLRFFERLNPEVQLFKSILLVRFEVR